MLRLRDFLSRRGGSLQLEALTGEVGLDRQLPDAEVAGPGLALAGYTGRFAPNRLHVPRGEVLIAKGEAEDHRTALDRAEDKMRKQLEKASARPRRSRSSQAEPL